MAEGTMSNLKLGRLKVDRLVGPDSIRDSPLAETEASRGYDYRRLTVRLSPVVA